MMLVYGWAHSVFWAAGPLVGWGEYIYDTHTNTCRPNWAAVGTVNKSYVVLLSIVAFNLPVLVMILCYAKIFSVVEKHVKDIEKTSVSAASLESILNLDSVQPHHEVHRSRDLRAHKMILLIIVVFFACWFPYSIIVMKKMLMKETSGSYWSVNGGLTLALLTTAVNPLIYAMRDRRFKRGFMKFFCGLRNTYDPDNGS
jgi:hypothetical protein